MPVPRLDDSCERFLEWCAPLLSGEELASTEAAVAAFRRQESPAWTLQAALEQYNTGGDVHSWLDAFWASRYLGRRDRIALNANFFCLFDDGGGCGQLERAAELIAAAVRYKLLLDDEHIPPAEWRGRPLSMAQHRFLFSTTRIPGIHQDTVRTPSRADRATLSRERHIVVFHRGHLFRMDVLDAHGMPHTTDQLRRGLGILIARSRHGRQASVGHLTTRPRAEWARLRRALLERDRRNARLLDTVETALFCVCLDDSRPLDAREACAQLLHGDSANRWFDKSFSLIVFDDGTAGINVEHSSLDGTTISEFADTLLGELVEHDPFPHTGAQAAPEVDELEFQLGAEIEAEIHAAAASFAAHAADTTTAVLSVDGLGREAAKQLGIAPDAFAQMAFQLAHHRARGLVGATYESIAMRHYRHGRTEAMRVVTPAVLAWVASMEAAGADDGGRGQMLRAAATKHAERAAECQAGRAPEQHLWELQLIQTRCLRMREAGERLGLYESPGWLKLRDDYLSTSSTSAETIRYAGFGPTGTHCVGISYILARDSARLFLSAGLRLRSELSHLADNLPGAVREMQAVLTATSR